ncbi:MAG: hypothetical protein KF774_05515 [Planctomyces sp.]|nr:hypothetical protein [Planctomyces sp.]
MCRIIPRGAAVMPGQESTEARGRLTARLAVVAAALSVGIWGAAGIAWALIPRYPGSANPRHGHEFDALGIVLVGSVSGLVSGLAAVGLGARACRLGWKWGIASVAVGVLSLLPAVVIGVFLLIRGP